MAYLDVRDPAAAATPDFSPRHDPIEPAGFERQEWEVIVLAQQDGLASLRAPTRLARFAALLFGGSVDRRLANPKLEALRRLAVLSWHHGYAVPVSAMKEFKAAGFSMEQLELLLASIANGRPTRGGAYA